MRRGPSATLTLVVALGLAAVSAHPALASVSTKQVSVTRRGGDPERGSSLPSISADGRYVAFASEAGDLVPDDHSIYFSDIFVRDLVAGTTIRASVDTEGGDPNDRSYSVSISAEGRYVAFASSASDLVAADGNHTEDIFVRDVVSGTTVRASVDTGGGDSNGTSSSPSISADGRYVEFSSDAPDLVAGDQNGLPDVFVRDTLTGTTVRASVDTEGGDANDSSFDASISADGRFVGFSSWASDLIKGDGNGLSDIFVRDLIAGTTLRASAHRESGDSNGSSGGPSISADGRYVAFYSYATDLVQGDGNGFPDVFVRDLVAETTVRASVDTEGEDANGLSFGSAMSADGRYLAFTSGASDLVAEDGNARVDVFVRDLMTGTTVRASLDTEGGDPNSSSAYASMGADGRNVAFESYASDLVSGRGDSGDDVFVVRLSQLPGPSKAGGYPHPQVT